MTEKIENIKKISPAIYELAFICFFLPFTHISCQGEKIVTLTGVQLITGTTIETPTPFSSFGERKEVKEVNSEPLATCVLLSIFGGFGLSFLKDKRGVVGPIVFGVIGLIFLLFLKAKIDSEVLREGEGVLRVEYGAGFWLILFLFLAVIAINGFLFSQVKKEKEGLQPL